MYCFIFIIKSKVSNKTKILFYFNMLNLLSLRGINS